MRTSKWNIKSTGENYQVWSGIHPVLAHIYQSRGFSSPIEAESQYKVDDVHVFDDFDPFEITDMRLAVDRIRDAIENNESIAVYGDFDADGVTSTSIMYEMLTDLRANVIAWIPDRIEDGYGLNKSAIDDLASQGIQLIITVDCGIRSVEEVDHAQSLGLDVIVTDHHDLGTTLPNSAVAIVNPKRDPDGRFSSLAGAGVALLVSIAMLKYEFVLRERSPELEQAYKSYLTGLLDLAAIGTVADVMDLSDPVNRKLVVHGLDTFNRLNRIGLAALAESSEILPGSITSESIGFKFGPKINAAGRLGSAMIAFELLTTKDAHRAIVIAGQLESINTRRQQLTKKSYAEVISYIEYNQLQEGNIIIVQNNDIHPGIVGLVAAKVVGDYGIPTIILESGDSISKGSCRSVDGFDITEALSKCDDLLESYGGHGIAAGLSLQSDSVEEFIRRMGSIADQEVTEEMKQKSVDVDCPIKISLISEGTFESLKSLEPTGKGNPAPVFYLRNVYVIEGKAVGSDRTHLKLKVTDGSGAIVAGIAFGMAHMIDSLTKPVDVAFQIQRNEWNRKVTYEMMVKDIRISEAVQDEENA